MSIGENIKNLRLKYGLEQSQIATIAGVTNKAVSSWELGNSVPRMGAIEKIATHFNIKKSDIIDENPIQDIDDAAFAMLKSFNSLNDQDKKLVLNIIEDLQNRNK